MIPWSNARVCVECAIEQWSGNFVEVSASKSCCIEVASIGEVLENRAEDVYGNEKAIV